MVANTQDWLHRGKSCLDSNTTGLVSQKLDLALTLTLTLMQAITADDGGRTLMSETHTTHHDAPRFLSWAWSSAVAKPQTGYIVASLAWVRVPLWALVSRGKIDVTPTVTLRQNT